MGGYGAAGTSAAAAEAEEAVANEAAEVVELFEALPVGASLDLGFCDMMLLLLCLAAFVSITQSESITESHSQLSLVKMLTIDRYRRLLYAVNVDRCRHPFIVDFMRLELLHAAPR
jgi:RNA 3'-terminal phosphate cyclase